MNYCMERIGAVIWGAAMRSSRRTYWYIKLGSGSQVVYITACRPFSGLKFAVGTYAK